MKLIKKFRDALGMTQPQLAKLIGRSHQTVAMYETEIPDEMLLQLAAIAMQRGQKQFALDFERELHLRQYRGERIEEERAEAAQNQSSTTTQNQAHTLPAGNEWLKRFTMAVSDLVALRDELPSKGPGDATGEGHPTDKVKRVLGATGGAGSGTASVRKPGKRNPGRHQAGGSD